MSGSVRSVLRRALSVGLLSACLAPPALAGGASSTPSSTEKPVSASVFDGLTLTALDGAPLDPATLAGKAVLFVNVASRCGYTPQYAGLQALYDAKKDAGLVIVGVPCNQFGGQEPGSAEQIASFCQMNYGVAFPLLEKQDVNGEGRSPLYQRLVGSEAGGGADVKWNFEKFLVGRDGQVVGRFASGDKPDGARLTQAVDQALAAQP